MARAGRRKKLNVIRDASGKSRGEPFDPNFHFQQPHRKPFLAVIEERKLDPSHPRIMNQAGYPLGRLRIALAISGDQLAGGNAYAALVHAYGRRMGVKIGSPKSGSMNERISTGFSPFEADINPSHQKTDQDIQDLYDTLHCDLVALGRAHNRGHKILNVMRDVCISEQDERQFWRDDAAMGDLRLGLNLAHRNLIKNLVERRG